MTAEKKFYLLVIDEVREQPGLVDELPFELEHHARLFAGQPLDAALARLHERRLCESGQGFATIDRLPPPPPLLVQSLEQLKAGLGDDLLAGYMALCRGALLNLLWRDFVRAEERINLAKYLRDEWAFAHFIFGLLRGIDGELGKAHFELYLAVNREGLSGARARIERALDLVR